MRITDDVHAHERHEKPLNLTVSTKTRDKADRLSQDSGDGSISNLFERLIEEETERDTADVDSKTWSEPSVWTAMLLTIPQAASAFAALTHSPAARAAFREATGAPAVRTPHGNTAQALSPEKHARRSPRSRG